MYRAHNKYFILLHIPYISIISMHYALFCKTCLIILCEDCLCEHKFEWYDFIEISSMKLNNE